MTARRRPRLFALALRIYVGAVVGAFVLGIATVAYFLVVDTTRDYAGGPDIGQAMLGFVGGGVIPVIAELVKVVALSMLVAFALNRDERGPLIVALVGQAAAVFAMVIGPIVPLLSGGGEDIVVLLLALQAVAVIGSIMVLTGMLTAANRVAHHAGAYETAERALRVRIMWTMVFVAVTLIVGFSFIVPATAFLLLIVALFALIVGVMTILVYLDVAKAVATDWNYQPGDLEPEVPTWTDIADDLSDFME